MAHCIVDSAQLAAENSQHSCKFLQNARNDLEPVFGAHKTQFMEIELMVAKSYRILTPWYLDR